MKFAEPSWLLAGLLVIAGLIALYRLLDLRQRAALAEFASSHLLAKLTASFSPGRRMLKRALFLMALACIFTALARPQWGYHWVDEKERGIDILFAIDTSKSMLTQDVTPDRLTRAKMAITDFVRKLDGDRVGLIAFAGEAFLQAPLTLDYDAFQDTLDSIDVNTIPRGGTDIGGAIEEAQAAFTPGTQNKKILVLVTDGEDLEGQGIGAARAAAKDGLVIYTVGVGTSAGGIIPVSNGNGGTDFVKDDSGQFVKSHLDENTLTQIAEATGGMYQPLGQQGQGLGVIYDKALASLPKHDITSRRTRVYEERFQWPLAAGLVFLFASVLIGTRRREPRPVRRAGAVRAAKAALVLAALALPGMAHASVGAAENAYKKGEYDKAEAQYEDAASQHPDNAPLQYDLGAAAYKSGEFDTALPAFQKALGSDDPALQQKAYYNIGNTQYRVGQKTEKATPQDTIKQWQGAVQAFDSALKLKPDDADAKFNRDFVEKKLEKLEKQQKQKQKQDQQKQDQKQQQQNQQQQNQQQNQGQQNQQQQNQQQNQSQNQQQQNQGSQGNPQNQQQGGQNQAQNGGQPQDQNGQQQQSAGNQNQNQQPGGQQQQQQQQSAGNQQPKNDQGGQQQQQSAGNQDQQKNPDQPQNGNSGGGGDQQKQTAQNQSPGGGAASAAAGADKNSNGQAEASLPAGELTREQAKDLLSSLKGEEHILPVTSGKLSAKSQDRPVLKDW